MKNTQNIDMSLTLHNTDNFKNILTQDIFAILEKYKKLVIEYLNYAAEVTAIKKKCYLKFILMRGLDTLTNVFNNILFYTKSLELSYFHSQKAYYFYIEFIEQISEDKHTFLQLSSRDATNYVYKKTIFEINNEYRKNIENTNAENIKKFTLLTEHIKLYKIIAYKIINACFFSLPKNESSIQNMYTDMLEKIIFQINNIKMDNQIIQSVNLLTNELDNKIEDIPVFFTLLTQIVKKIAKCSVDVEKIKEKIFSEAFDKWLEESHEKFVNWILS